MALTARKAASPHHQVIKVPKRSTTEFPARGFRRISPYFSTSQTAPCKKANTTTNFFVCIKAVPVCPLTATKAAHRAGRGSDAAQPLPRAQVGLARHQAHDPLRAAPETSHPPLSDQCSVPPNGPLGKILLHRMFRLFGAEGGGGYSLTYLSLCGIFFKSQFSPACCTPLPTSCYPGCGSGLYHSPILSHTIPHTIGGTGRGSTSLPPKNTLRVFVSQANRNPQRSYLNHQLPEEVYSKSRGVG